MCRSACASTSRMGSETWTRTFGAKTLHSAQFAESDGSGGLICERFGPLTFVIHWSSRRDVRRSSCAAGTPLAFPCPWSSVPVRRPVRRFNMSASVFTSRSAIRDRSHRALPRLARTQGHSLGWANALNLDAGIWRSRCRRAQSSQHIVTMRVSLREGQVLHHHSHFLSEWRSPYRPCL